MASANPDRPLPAPQVPPTLFDENPDLGRRDWLRRSVFGVPGALGAFGLGACSPPTDPGSARALASGRHFAPVKVSRERLIRTVVGLRPFRPSGFVLREERPEALGGKLLVHNYGHGGGGVTLSWGTAELAVEKALAAGARSYAVLGCGAVGLATARLLQRSGGKVTIYTKDLPPRTTSNIAGAKWSPFSVSDRDRRSPEFLARFERAARLSHRSFQELVGPRYGVRWIENYGLSDEPGTSYLDDPLADLYPDSETFGPGEHPFPRPYARRFSTMFIETPLYLEAVLQDFFVAGGKLEVRAFDTPAQLNELKEPVVMNCTGLGSKALFGDEELRPVKGQLAVLLPQPEVDYILLSGRHYMFPRADGILLGGTTERDVWTLDTNEAAEEEILEGHRRLFEGV